VATWKTKKYDEMTLRWDLWKEWMELALDWATGFTEGMDGTGSGLGDRIYERNGWNWLWIGRHGELRYSPEGLFPPL
jgi:hypothetical protein